MGSLYQPLIDVVKAAITMKHYLFQFGLLIVKNMYAVNNQLRDMCKGSSERNQFCNFVKFAQEEDSSDMFVIFALIVGTIVYLHYSYCARLTAVHGTIKIFALVLTGQIVVVCSMLVSHQPIEAFKHAFGIVHKKKMQM